MEEAKDDAKDSGHLKDDESGILQSLKHQAQEGRRWFRLNNVAAIVFPPHIQVLGIAADSCRRRGRREIDVVNEGGAGGGYVGGEGGKVM